MTIKAHRVDPARDAHRRQALILLFLVTVTMLAIGTAFSMTSCAVGPSAGGVRVAIPDGRDLRVLYVGDSLSAGLYTSSPDKGFRPRLNAAFEMVHSIETGTVGARDFTASTIDLTTIGSDWDLAVVEQGTNDAGRSDLHQFRSDYAKLLDAIRAQSPLVQLVCLGVWAEPRYAKYYDGIVETECMSRGGTFRKIYDIYDDPANRGPAGIARFGGISDNFHPNDLGHERISERLAEAITLTGAPQPWYRTMFARLRNCAF